MLLGDGNTNGVPIALVSFTLTLSRERTSSVIGIVRRAAFVFPKGLNIVFRSSGRKPVALGLNLLMPPSIGTIARLGCQLLINAVSLTTPAVARVFSLV